jgi:hypothetical protein
METPGITVRPIVTIDGGREVNEVFSTTSSARRKPRRRGEQGLDYAKYLLGRERTGIARVG